MSFFPAFLFLSSKENPERFVINQIGELHSFPLHENSSYSIFIISFRSSTIFFSYIFELKTRKIHKTYETPIGVNSLFLFIHLLPLFSFVRATRFSTRIEHARKLIERTNEKRSEGVVEETHRLCFFFIFLSRVVEYLCVEKCERQINREKEKMAKWRIEFKSENGTLIFFIGENFEARVKGDDEISINQIIPWFSFFISRIRRNTSFRMITTQSEVSYKY